MLALAGLFASITFTSLAQSNLVDVIYLKNGSIIRGIVVEQVPGQAIKLQTGDGNLFVFEAEEILKMTREAATTVAPQRLDNQNVQSQLNMASNAENDGKQRDEWGNTYQHNLEVANLKRMQGAIIVGVGGLLFAGGATLVTIGATAKDLNSRDEQGYYFWGGVSGILSLPLLITGAVQLTKSGVYRRRAQNMSGGSARLSPVLIGTQQYSGALVRSGSAVGLTLTYRF
jgi:hypothetical protein